MAEQEGFEPSQGVNLLPVFKTGPFNQTWVFLQKNYNGGGKGIRTPAPLSRPLGFQDRSLQPDLGIPPTYMVPEVGLEPTRGLNLAGF